MPIPVTDILSRTSDLLLDATMVRWTKAERIRWGNEAMGAILVRRPAAFADRLVMVLAAGTAQALIEGSAQLLDVVRNVGADGVTAGRVIRRTDRQLLDDSNPDWHTATPKSQIRQFTFDDRAPTLFYVSPPAVAGTKVEVLHAAMPQAADENGTGTFPIGAEYTEAVVNYICYRAKSKDAEDGQAGDAAAYYAAFQAALGENAGASTASSPNQPTNSV